MSGTTREHAQRERMVEWERRRTLARFLSAPEDADAIDLDKPRMEPLALRAGHGPCDQCGTVAILHRYEVDERHHEGLTCSGNLDGASNDNNGLWICSQHLHGTFPGLPGHGAPWCVDPDDEGQLFEDCPIVAWLETGHVPWLCPTCWKRLANAEAEHLAAWQQNE